MTTTSNIRPRAIAGAGPLVASAMDHPAVSPHLDLDLLGVFRVAASQEGLAAVGADTVLGRQFEDFLAGGQMGVIPAFGSRVLRLLTTIPPGSLGVVLGIIQVIGAIVARLGLGAPPEEIGLELAFLPFELFDLLLQRGEATQGIPMPTLPVAHLLTQFEVLTLQTLDLGPQRGHFLTQVRHQGDQLRDGVPRVVESHQLAVHDHHALPETAKWWKGLVSIHRGVGVSIDDLGEALPKPRIPSPLAGRCYSSHISRNPGVGRYGRPDGPSAPPGRPRRKLRNDHRHARRASTATGRERGADKGRRRGMPLPETTAPTREIRRARLRRSRPNRWVLWPYPFPESGAAFFFVVAVAFFDLAVFFVAAFFTVVVFFVAVALHRSGFLLGGLLHRGRLRRGRGLRDLGGLLRGRFRGRRFRDRGVVDFDVEDGAQLGGLDRGGAAFGPRRGGGDRLFDQFPVIHAPEHEEQLGR